MSCLPAALVIAFAFAASASAQTTHKVPQDHPTIQEAVDAAADGDTILVSAGTYEETVTVTGKSDLTILGKGKVIIAPPAGDGLVLDTCGDCTVKKIRVQGGDTGIHLVDTHDTVLSKCRVEDTAMDGIRVEGGHDNVVDKFVVDGPAGNGIVLINSGGDYPHDDTLSHGQVLAAAVDGIVLTGDNHVVDHCKVVAPQGRGVVCDDTTHANEDSITHCSVTDAGSDGIAISGVSLVVSSCKVTGSHNVGIFDEGGFLDDISHCKVTDAGTVGIACAALTVEVSIHDCKVKASVGDGIAITGLGNVVEHNKVSKTGEDGIDTSAGGGSITGNKVTASVADGIRLSAGANNNTLTFNKAHGSGGFDFDDVAADATNEVDDTNDFGTTGP